MKKQDFLQLLLLLKNSAKYCLYLEPEPEQELFQSRNRNRN